ncbi:MAG: hypothetical protein AAF481_02045 [Acidobacteriota bacterium]
MFKTIAVAATMLIALPCFAATEGLAEAVARHQSGAPDSELELSIVESLSKLKNDGWLPDFWSAYILTQVVMRHPEDRAKRLARAQDHLTRAMEKARRSDEAPMGDLFSLQSLVYSFSSGQAKNKEEAEKIQEAATAELAKAFEVAVDSPTVMVMAATELIKVGQKEESRPHLMAGKALLEKARERFEASDLPLGETTHFNGEWVQPWIDWVDRMLADGFSAE